MSGHLVLVLGDQLSDQLVSLRDADPDSDRIVMAEVRDEATYVPHHPQKILLLFSAMRHFAERLRAQGFVVDYYDYDQGLSSLADALVQSSADTGITRVRLAEPGEWRLKDAIMKRWPEQTGLSFTLLEDDRFLCSHEQFRRWASGRKSLRMENFYRDMRRRTGLLMEPDGQPAGDRWNYDSANRQPYKGQTPVPTRPDFRADKITKQARALVEREFGHHFGDLDQFNWPVTRDQAQQALSHFIEHGLASFGDYQDAMVGGEPFLFHSLISTSLNCGLLLPLEVCEAAEQAWRDGDAPLNAVEGFIRQIIGWREYVRGIYWLKMPDYVDRNDLDSQRPLPHFYWTGETGMHCMADAIDSTRRHAYSHHIQRLMVTGNFALIAGLSVQAIHEWYLAVYADAYEWVELPNTLGMVMHADGGLLGSKPYAASGKYIHRMSDHCRQCRYRVTTATDPDSCPFNSLYWHFIRRHRGHFENHPRMAMIYRSWEKMDANRKRAIMARANHLLENLDQL